MYLLLKMKTLENGPDRKTEALSAGGNRRKHQLYLQNSQKNKRCWRYRFPECLRHSNLSVSECLHEIFKCVQKSLLLNLP